MKRLTFILITILLLLTGCSAEKSNKKIPDDLLGTYTLDTRKMEIEYGGTYKIGKVTLSKSGKSYTIDLTYKYMNNKRKNVNKEIVPEKIITEDILNFKGKVSKIVYAEKSYEGYRDYYAVYFDPKDTVITGTNSIVTDFTVSPQIWLIRQYIKDDKIYNALKIEGETFFKSGK